jgi:hypothetical protein
MKRFCTVLSFLSVALSGYSQGEFNNWYFGNYKVVDFNGGIPALKPNSSMMAAGTTVNVSDSAGNILFYCNGESVYNRLDVMMPHGDSLFGNFGSFTQHIEVVQSPGDDSIYFLFNPGTLVPGYYVLHPAVYSVLDMRLDNRLGDIDSTRKNIPLPFAGTAFKTVTGTRHANNRDAWIVFRLLGPDSNFYASYMVTSAGVDTVPVLSPSLVSNNPIPPFNDPPNKFLRISPDGHNLICLYYSDTMEVCYFNDTTGQVIPRFRYHSPGGMMTSAEFSIDSRLLYTGWGNNTLDQYDITAEDSASFAQSPIEVGTGAFIAHSAMQMGPDGKIYGTRDVTPYLWVVNFPSVRGIGCGFNPNGFFLSDPSHSDGLPQFIQRYKVYLHHEGDCANDSILFIPDIWPPPDSLHWDFGDPASGAANFSGLENPFHVYSTGGTYTARLFVRHIDKRTDTASTIITILPPPVVSLGPDVTICTGGSWTFTADTCAGCTYTWSNLTAGLPNIGTGSSYTASAPAMYMITVTDTNGCQGRDTVELMVTSNPLITNDTLAISICSGGTTNIIPTSNVSGIQYSWTASLQQGTVTGFYPDSGLVISQALFNPLSVQGIVVYHVVPKLASCIGDTTDFMVTVFPSDTVNVTIAASQNNVCAGTSVTFTATPVNGGSNPTYQWKVNGFNAGTDSPVFTYSPNNGDVVQCILTSSYTVCTSNNPASSNTIVMTVNPVLPVSVSVSITPNPVCSGLPVTCTAIPVNPGNAPIYQWTVNALNAGTNSPVFTYSPYNGDLVQCVLTSSNAVCTSNNPATSNTITVIANPLLPVSVSVSASSNPFCLGTLVTFTATPTNGGTTPFYQWQVNGLNVGSNSLSYSYFPGSGDIVACVLTSSLLCVSGNPGISNLITMTDSVGPPAGISIAANPNPFCPGSPVTCSATPSNGGTNPFYQWKVNGVNVGSNSPTYTFNPLNNDSVRCVMTSNLSCVSGNPASSNKIILSGALAPVVTFTACFDTITTLNARPIKLKGGIPLNGIYSGPGVNPATGLFTPSTAGIGIKTITYTYTNFALCSASKTRSIQVVAAPLFTCGNNLTDIRDNKVYPTIQIGSQCWMAANLNYGSMISGNSHQRDNCIPEKYLPPPPGLPQPGEGSVYQWDELMGYSDTEQAQGLCPPGWHVPTEAEWQILFAN